MEKFIVTRNGEVDYKKTLGIAIKTALEPKLAKAASRIDNFFENHR